jgi:hypothetical protein
MLHGISARVVRAARLLGAALFTTVGAALWGACGGDDGPTGPAGCGESTVVSVTAGLEPTFSWAGGCRVRGVIVEQLTPAALMWEFTTSNEDQQNVFDSPIQYGRLPATGGARLRSGPVPLVAGRRYLVMLRAVGRDGCSGLGGCATVSATATFVP